MAQQVDIPGLGIVEFPDGMSDDDIASAIKKNIMPTLPAASTSGSVGRTLAGFADTVLGAPGALANQIGYAGARALGRSPEEAKKAEVFETQPLAKAFGVGNSPEYRSEASQRLNAFIGENVGKGAKWISEQTGRPQEDIENIIGTLAMGAGVKTAPYTTPIAKKAIGVVGNAAEKATVATAKGAATAGRNVAALPGDVVKGTLNAARSDTPVSSLKISEKTLNQATDAASHASGKAAVGPLGELAIRASGREVPIQGRVIENMAETAARGYKDIFNDRRSGVYGGAQGIADIAGLMGIGLPFQGSLMRAGIPAALKAANPLRAVDPADMKGMTVGGKPATFDIFSGRNTDYIQSAGPENAGRRTYGRQMEREDMPGYTPPRPVPEKWTADKGWPGGPAPLRIGHTMYATESGVVGGDMNRVQQAELAKKYAPQKADEPLALPAPVEQLQLPASSKAKQPQLPAPEVPLAPSFKPLPELGKSSMAEILAKMRASGKTNMGNDKAPGKREANAANKLYKEENLKKTISEWNNADSPVRNIATQPVDTTDMDNATRGMYNMLKKAGGGVFDEIPSMEWLKDHGITEQAFIRRLVGGSRPKK